MTNLFYVLCGLGPLLLLAYKYRAALLAPSRYRATIQAVCAGAVCAGFSFLLASPAAGPEVNALTGIPSFAMMLAMVLGQIWVCFSVVSVAYWRYPPDRARPIARWMLLGYAAVLSVEIALFVAGKPVASHHSDFTSAFATTPYLGEMLVLHFAAYVAGLIYMVATCWRWARRGRNLQKLHRIGLRLIAVGAAFPTAFGLITLIAVIGMRFGADLKFWSVVVAPQVAGFGVPVGLVGMMIAIWGPRLSRLGQRISRSVRDFRDYRELRALWRVLRPVAPEMVHRPETLREWINLRSRLRWRLTEIHDWLHRLGPYRAPQLTAAGTAGEPSTKDCLAQVEAEQIRAAIEAKEAGVRINSLDEPVDAPADPQRAFAGERARLVLIARAIRAPATS